MGTYERVKACIREQIAVCVVTLLQGGSHPGAKLLVFGDAPPEGTLHLGELEARVVEDARVSLRASRSETRSYQWQAPGAESTEEVQVFFDSMVPPPWLIIVGAGHTSIPLASFGRLCGFKVTLIDARSAFATRERFKDPDDILVEWPHEAIDRLTITDSTYVAVLTHDAKFEEPLLPRLLRSRARYIGVIGSKKTQLQRRERLRREGFSDDDLRRLSGPIGLDLGAVTPEEIALSIMAEIVAKQHQRSGGSLTDAFNASLK